MLGTFLLGIGRLKKSVCSAVGNKYMHALNHFGRKILMSFLYLSAFVCFDLFYQHLMNYCHEVSFQQPLFLYRVGDCLVHFG